uniref:Capping actin protein, gelsolin like n=1 Tax=Zosterops lateralis melanops TaxID=1220523 RepID=A0A8D2PH96_ZOSLA
MYTALPKRYSLPTPPTPSIPGVACLVGEAAAVSVVPEATLGVFFSGDTYLVLHNGTEEQAHLHLWVGRDSSQDEGGTCTLLSTQLSSLLGEHPVTHHGEGGMALPFKHTHPGPDPTSKLYQVKGKGKIWVRHWDPSWASFNTGDCFLLNLGQNLFICCGAQSNVLEHSRVQELAAAIWHSEWGGKAHLEVVADGEEPPEMQVLGPKPALQEGSPEEDMVADQSNTGAAVLNKVSDTTRHMDLTQVATSSPVSQNLLCPDDCFVLDNGAGQDGRKANEQECQAALRVAKEVITSMGLLPQTQVGGHRTPFFKQFFASWK